MPSAPQEGHPLRNFIRQEEIDQYLALRDQGLKVREAAAIVGRAPSAMHKHEPNRKTRTKAPKLEAALTGTIDEALAELFPASVETTDAPTKRVETMPTIQARIQRLVANIFKQMRRKVTA